MFCTKCGLELPDDSQFCRKCGHGLAPTKPRPLATTASAPTASAFNFGTLVFAGFSVLSLIVSLANGVVPIYLLEAILWAALSWVWHKKNPTSQLASAAILLLAIAVAAGEGFIVGRQVSKPTDDWKAEFRSTPRELPAPVPLKADGESVNQSQPQSEDYGFKPAKPTKPEGDMFAEFRTPTAQSAKPISKPKPTEPKGWATVKEDSSIFKHCHFESGNQNVDGCDFVMTTGDPYPSAIVVLKQGDRVGLLSDRVRASGGEDVYKVKFRQWTGWMAAADLTPD